MSQGFRVTQTGNYLKPKLKVLVTSFKGSSLTNQFYSFNWTLHLVSYVQLDLKMFKDPIPQV
jgi:hypothetical protein